MQWDFKANGKPLTRNVSVGRRGNNGELLREAAIAGLGITCLANFIVALALKDGRLLTLLDDLAPDPLTLSAVYPQHRQSSQPVQALIEFLRERLAGC